MGYAAVLTGVMPSALRLSSCATWSVSLSLPFTVSGFLGRATGSMSQAVFLLQFRNLLPAAPCQRLPIMMSKAAKRRYPCP
jgi:hypothetical protein